MKMARSTTCVAALSLIAAASAAAPTALNASVDVEVWDSNFVELDALDLLENRQVNAGGSEDLSPHNPSFASAVNVDYRVVTVGLSRTVTITYTALGDQFVNPAAFDSMEPVPENGRHQIKFNVSIDDSDWDGDIASRTARASLSGDGQAILEGDWLASSTTFLTSFARGFVGRGSPAETGFFGADVIADQFVYELTYTLVPAPGAFALLGLAGLTASRRSRRTDASND